MICCWLLLIGSLVEKAWGTVAFFALVIIGRHAAPRIREWMSA
jgi:hypothetical protein